jgi:hypothetical protein
MRNESTRYHLLYSAIVAAFILSLTSRPASATETTATSSLTGSDPMAVLDGDSNTVWRSVQNDAQEITVDLGYPWPIRSVEIEWGKSYPSEYEVQLTTDGKTWKTIAHPTDFKVVEQKSWAKFKFTVHKIKPAVEARGLRIRCLAASNGFEMVNL